MCERNINWIQISDLHFVENDSRCNIMKSSFLRQCSDHMFQGKRVDFVVVTGDFKNYSDKEELFELAVDFIVKLFDEKHLNLSLDSDLFIVPGNHDIKSDDINTLEDRKIIIEKLMPENYKTFLEELHKKKIEERKISEREYLIRCESQPKDFIQSLESIVKNYRSEIYSVFEPYNVRLAKVLISEYSKTLCSYLPHIRVWNNNIQSINVIHLNSVILADGERCHFQAIDILKLSELLCNDKYDFSLPSLIIIHNNYYEIHPEVRKMLVQMMNQMNVVAWLCGDAHSTNQFDENSLISRKIIAGDSMGWPIYVCPKTISGLNDDWSEFGFLYYSWNGKAVEVSYYCWDRNGDGKNFANYNINQFTMEKEKKLEEPLYRKTPKITNGKTLIDITNIDQFSDSELSQVDEKVITYMYEALGKNTYGKSRRENMKAFFELSDTIFNNDIRYDVPQFALDIPRSEHGAYLYIGNNIIPVFEGIVTCYYRNECERYIFNSDYLILFIELSDKKTIKATIDYSVLADSIACRYNILVKIQSLMTAKLIKIVSKDQSFEKIEIQDKIVRKNRGYRQELSLLDFWITEMQKMKVIEQEYSITFKLVPIQGWENIKKLYWAIDNIYAGIQMAENCTINVPTSFSKIHNITYPCLVEKDSDIPLQEILIYEYEFIPRSSALLKRPKKSRKNNGRLYGNGSVVYAVKLNGNLIYPKSFVLE